MHTCFCSLHSELPTRENPSTFPYCSPSTNPYIKSVKRRLLPVSFHRDTVYGQVLGDLDDQTLLSLAAHDNRPISEIEKQKPLLLHGRAAAVKLFRDFGVDDTDILQAVARHTLGCEKMRPLAKIIFIADKIEPGRPQSNQKYREPFYTMSLDQMCLTVLDENIAYQKSKNKPVVAQTLAFRESLIRDIQKASNGGAQ